MSILVVGGAGYIGSHIAKRLSTSGKEVITLDMRTGELLLQGIHRIQSFSRIRRSVGPMRSSNWRIGP